MMEHDRPADRPLASFTVETVTMADGRSIRYYTWSDEAPEASAEGPSGEGAGPAATPVDDRPPGDDRDV